MEIIFDISIISVEEKKQRTLNGIMTAKNKIRYEIAELNERLKQSKEAIQKFKEEINKLDNQGGDFSIPTSIQIDTI